MHLKEIIQTIVLLWTVIDPIGTIPVFIAVTKKHKEEELHRIAIRSICISAGILLFFVIAGQFVLEAMQIPLPAFQIAGGIVLFLFALTMIFGESKPDEEIHMLKSGKETAVFPLAVPSIASPGAMMAVVMLTDNHRFSVYHQCWTTLIMVGVLLVTLGLLLMAKRIYRVIGDSGASIVSRVMGLILAAIAVNSVLLGIMQYFSHTGVL